MKKYKTKPTKKQVENILKFYDFNSLYPAICDKIPKNSKAKFCSLYGTSCKSRRKNK